jgi:hypothetical protein
VNGAQSKLVEAELVETTSVVEIVQSEFVVTTAGTGVAQNSLARYCCRWCGCCAVVALMKHY